MKVRVTKQLWSATKGTEIIDPDGVSITTQQALDAGFFEEVKESKSLEEEICDIPVSTYNGFIHPYGSGVFLRSDSFEAIAKIARTHYEKKFDDYLHDFLPFSDQMNYERFFRDFRKHLFKD